MSVKRFFTFGELVLISQLLNREARNARHEARLESIKLNLPRANELREYADKTEGVLRKISTIPGVSIEAINVETP